MPDSPLKNETTSDVVTFEFFDKTWSVPAQQRMSHVERFDQHRRKTSNIDLALARTYLPDDQVEELRKLDPTVTELDEFGNAIGKAMGFGDAGNS